MFKLPCSKGTAVTGNVPQSATVEITQDVHKSECGSSGDDGGADYAYVKYYASSTTYEGWVPVSGKSQFNHLTKCYSRRESIGSVDGLGVHATFHGLWPEGWVSDMPLLVACCLGRTADDRQGINLPAQ